MKAVVLLCLPLLMLTTSVHADYVLEVHLLQFRNPSGRTSIDVCCDFDCRNACDNRFVFCLRPSGTVTNDDDNCPLGRFRTGVIADNNAEFNLGELDPEQDISNPLNFTGPLWPGAVQLYITVTDENTILPDILVDRFFIDVKASVSSGITMPTFYNGDERIGEIQLSFQVTCTENFFGSDCATFCVERDDELGHFTCDKEGNIVCREGYGNPSINCTCAVTEGCSSVGGYCLESGECLCHEGFFGDDCSLSQESSDSQAVAAGVVVVLLVVIILPVGTVLIVVFLTKKRKRSTRKSAGNHKPSQEVISRTPGENPTYTGDVATQGGSAPSTHNYEYISTNFVRGQAHSGQSELSSSTYCYIANTVVQTELAPAVTGQSAQQDTLGRTWTPAPSVHYETMNTGPDWTIEVIVDPTNHYEFDEEHSRD